MIDQFKEMGFAEILPISAKTSAHLDLLTQELLKLMPTGPRYFPEDMITDQPERVLCAEIVREKLLQLLDKEVPHGTAVEITRFHEREDGVIEIDATIYCEKASHKGIIIGKNGAMLKSIATHARASMEKLLGDRVFLELWIKVKPNWRDNPYMLNEIGYDKSSV